MTDRTSENYYILLPPLIRGCPRFFGNQSYLTDDVFKARIMYLSPMRVLDLVQCDSSIECAYKLNISPTTPRFSLYESLRNYQELPVIAKFCSID